jgi:glycerol-3-phosphate acyltransferase PlsX
MGGDFAPAETVAGAVQAARKGGLRIMLVGEAEQVQAELAKHDASRLPIGVVPSSGVISENEHPAMALRQKPKASVAVATGMVKQGLADACVSMGSTGAAMASAAVILGVIEGVERPALGGPIVGLAPQTMVLDLGTNVDCRPIQLVSYGVIGEVFSRQSWGIEKPTIAILSVGAEAGKGNRQVREAAALLEKSGLNFVGNIEADEIPLGKANVVLCDGFVGNVVMKLTEGLGVVIAEHIRAKFEGKLSKADLDAVVNEIYDVNNVLESAGGGPLLGVNGISVVGHGRAKANAVANAIATARLLVENRFIEELNRRLSEFHMPKEQA